jgi:hypothetical protein
VQGGALLANAFRNPELMTGQVRHLERWIDSLQQVLPGSTVLGVADRP